MQHNTHKIIRDKSGNAEAASVFTLSTSASCHRANRTYRYPHLDRGALRSKMSTMVSGYLSPHHHSQYLDQASSLMACRFPCLSVPSVSCKSSQTILDSSRNTTIISEELRFQAVMAGHDHVSWCCIAERFRTCSDV